MDNQTINDFHPIFLGTSMILPNFYEKHCYYCHTEEQHGCDTLTTSLHLESVSNKPPRPASLFQRAAPAPNGEKLRCPLWKINKEKKSKKEGQNCRENEICQLESTSGVQKYCEQQYQHIIILLAYTQVGYKCRGKTFPQSQDFKEGTQGAFTPLVELVYER